LCNKQGISGKKKGFFDMRRAILAVIAAAAMVTGAQAQTYDVRVDTQYPEKDLKDLTMLQGASPEVRVYVRQAGTIYNNITNHTATFYGGPTATATAFVQVTNSSVTPASGYFTIDFATTDTATNTSAGAWWYTILLRDASDRIYYSGNGDWNITASTAAGSPSSLDLSTPLDWSGYTFSNGSNYGPYKAGSNVTLGSPDGTGRIPINAAAGSDPTKLPLAGGTMDSGAVVNLNSGTIAGGALVQSTTVSGGVSARAHLMENTDRGLLQLNGAGGSLSITILADSGADMGGLPIDDTSAITMTGSAGTNMVMKHLFLSKTNYLAIHMAGSSTTNLYPVVH